MTTFHVLIDVLQAGKRTQWLPVFSDVSEDDLKARFVEPYLAGREIRGAEGAMQSSDISMVRIIRTEGGYEQALKTYRHEQYAREEEFMRASGMALPPNQHPAADLTVVGKDVTADYIPGRLSMNLDIDGLRVMVSAGASGIGLEIARAFVREGARVHVCDVDAAAIERLAKSDAALGATVCDVSDRAQVARFFAEAQAKLGGLDCLVANAGIAGPTGKVDEIDPAEWDRCIAIDLTGQFNCIRLAVPHLRASKNASIVAVSSLAGRLGFALRTPYAAAKWGVIGLARSLAVELGGDRIRVNALLPGVVSGERQKRVLTAKAQALGIGFEEMEERALSFTSLKEYVTPQQLADLVVFVASPRGRTISGQALSVCGDTNMLG